MKLWAVYVPGQERRMDPSTEYLDTALRLVDVVASRENAGMIGLRTPEWET